MNRAVFIERDGVLNDVRSGAKSQIQPKTFGEFKVKPEAFGPLKKISEAGFIVIVTTHQPLIALGSLQPSELDRMHRILKITIPVIKDIMVCPHFRGDECPCQPPQPGLLLDAALLWQLSLDHSFVISDKWQDAEAARRAGCKALLLRSAWNGDLRDSALPDLQTAIEEVIRLKTLVQLA